LQVSLQLRHTPFASAFLCDFALKLQAEVAISFDSHGATVYRTRGSHLASIPAASKSLGRVIMGSESQQHKLDRVRRPRVQITYDVETGGAMQKVELPFVVGVMADLSGQPKEALRPMKDRKFTTIDRDNFNEVLNRSAPRVAIKVDNKLTDANSKLAVELNIKSMDDFDPAKVAEQVPALKELLDMRHRLNQLMTKMEGNDKLEAMLADVLQNTEKAAALSKEMGGGAAEEKK
jgi:type VI secretion system protein ImpB